nr:MAG TPA: hypothetical protein [Caudoviricetes sp.]
MRYVRGLFFIHRIIKQNFYSTKIVKKRDKR